MALLRSSLSLIACLVLASAVRTQILFGPAKTTNPFVVTGSFDAADLNGDGLADIAWSSASGVSARMGDGTGGFGPTLSIATSLTGSGLVLADLDGDQVADLLATSTTSNELRVALADGLGGFEAPASYEIGAATDGRKIRVGDADADGDADVLVATKGTFGGPFGEVRLFVNDGAGALALGLNVPGDAAHTVLDAFPCALNADAEPDLVLKSTSETTFALVGEPGGAWSETWSAAGLDVKQVGDLDGDGNVDLVSMPLILFDPTVLTTYLGAGDGTFAAGPVSDWSVPLELGFATPELAFLDDDAVLDLVVAVPADGQGGGYWAHHGDGEGGFGPADARVSVILSGTIHPTSVYPPVLADFDGDGRLDVSSGATAPLSFFFHAAVALNRTYPQGSALLDLGHQLKPANKGYPIQLVEGSFAGGSPFAFSLAHGPASGLVYHVLGLSVINAPFKGGTMVPMPQLLSGPWPTTAAGTLLLAGTWPMGVPSGLQIAMQFWFAAPTTPAGFAASSGVLVTMP